MPSETERLELSQEAIFSICTKCDRLRKCFKGVFSMTHLEVLSRGNQAFFMFYSFPLPC